MFSRSTVFTVLSITVLYFLGLSWMLNAYFVDLDHHEGVRKEMERDLKTFQSLFYSSALLTNCPLTERLLAALRFCYRYEPIRYTLNETKIEVWGEPFDLETFLPSFSSYRERLYFIAFKFCFRPNVTQAERRVLRLTQDIFREMRQI